MVLILYDLFNNTVQYRPNLPYFPEVAPGHRRIRHILRLLSEIM